MGGVPARPGLGQAPGDHQGRGFARPRRSKEALYAAVLDHAARRIGGELQAQADQHGSVAKLLAHVLSPSQAGVLPASLAGHLADLAPPSCPARLEVMCLT